ncbi:MAG: molybdenum cofactor guanylyltransferase [Ignavibacteriales bacterium CG_4_9_14_3_um_filter_34_10]|nr:MAG: molybdenum cofactor guanylyltransferase [Ignavibacteriales bacterium CG_4_9_14_3_um_filter_34_10]
MTVTGIILAGGKSSRIGQNKALLELSGKKIIEIIYEKISPLFNDVIIISNILEDYKFMKLKIYKDIYLGLGPLAGIHSGLINSRTEKNFIISCDLPLITREAVDYIKNFNSDKSVVIYKKSGRIQFLCGIYNKKCLPVLDDLLKSNNLKVRDFIAKIDVEILDAEIFPDEIFFNLNTIQDYNYLLKRIQSV